MMKRRKNNISYLPNPDLSTGVDVEVAGRVEGLSVEEPPVVGLVVDGLLFVELPGPTPGVGRVIFELSMLGRLDGPGLFG